MRFRRLPIEIESPEQLAYDTIANNLSESSFSIRLAWPMHCCRRRDSSA